MKHINYFIINIYIYILMYNNNFLQIDYKINKIKSYQFEMEYVPFWQAYKLTLYNPPV